MNNMRYAERSAGVRQGLCSDEKRESRRWVFSASSLRYGRAHKCRQLCLTRKWRGYLESGNVKTDEEGPTASSSATVFFVVRRCRMLTQQSKLKQPGTNEYPPSCLRFKIVVHIGWECRVTLVRNPASDRIGQGTLHQAFRLEKNMNKILALLTFLILTAYALGQGSAPGTAAPGQQPTTSSASETAQLQQGSLI